MNTEEKKNNGGMSGGHPNPAHIMQLATGYWASATLLAANEIGLFDALAAGELSPSQVAAKLDMDNRAVRILLTACSGLGLLVEDNGRYSLTPEAAAFLVKASPASLNNALAWSWDQFSAWGGLPESIKSGEPAVDPTVHLGGDFEQTRTFVRAMNDRAKGIARGVVRAFDLAGCRTLLDVGGGPGAYACLLSQSNPDLTVTVLDLPGIIPHTREIVAEAGLSDRIVTVAGDATDGDYGTEKYDAVLFSGVLHQMSGQTVRRLIAAGNRALTKGGKIIVSDVILLERSSSNAFAGLFSLQMMLTSLEGEVFSASDCAHWMEEQGLEVQTESLPPPLPYVVITGRQPL